MKKVVFILLLVITILLSVYNVSNATSLDSIISGADSFTDVGKKADKDRVGEISDQGIINASNLIYNTLVIIGIIVVIIGGSILGIKYMTSSVEGQAKIKETLVPFIIGTVIIFGGALGIWQLAKSVLGNIN